MRERVHFISKELQGKHKTPPIYMIHSKDIGKGGDRSRKPGCEQGQIPGLLTRVPSFSCTLYPDQSEKGSENQAY